MNIIIALLILPVLSGVLWLLDKAIPYAPEWVLRAIPYVMMWSVFSWLVYVGLM